MITFERTGKRFGNLDAVKDFSITIKDGEILGLLGPNGAGKTTLMLMMGTVYRPTSGTISVNGYDVVKHPNEVRKLIGIAFQDPRVDGILSAFDVSFLTSLGCFTTSYPLTEKLIGIAFQDPRVDGILSAFDVLNWHLKMTTISDKVERR